MMETFNEQTFEQKLFKLKDTHDSISNLSAWCLANQQYHDKIVSSWLTVFKRVKIEQRVILFYLANDVVQYSKKKTLPFVDSFGPAFQKAVTMVREESVRPKMERLFDIWKQRGIYEESFLVDLSGLLSRGKTNRIDVNDFQPALLYSRLRSCKELEDDTDLKLKILSNCHISVTDIEKMRKSLKDRDSGTDLIPEVEEGIQKIKDYISALEAEIKERIGLIDLLETSEIFYADQLKEAKVVVNAYRCFGGRIKGVKRKLPDKIEELPSPPLSPDINAPSPSPSPDELEMSGHPFCGLNFSSGGSFMDGSLITQPYQMAGELSHTFSNELPMFNNNNVYSSDSLSNSTEGNKIEVVTRTQNLDIKNMKLSALLQSLIPGDNSDSQNKLIEPANNTILSSTPRSPSPQVLNGLTNKFPVWSDIQQDDWDSPESPPSYEKIGYNISENVDMRSPYGEVNTSSVRSMVKDVDHRNLISLTGGCDTDYRSFTGTGTTKSNTDNVENIDMDLSDDEEKKNEGINAQRFHQSGNATVQALTTGVDTLKQPPSKLQHNRSRYSPSHSLSRPNLKSPSAFTPQRLSNHPNLKSPSSDVSSPVEVITSKNISTMQADISIPPPPCFSPIVPPPNSYNGEVLFTTSKNKTPTFGNYNKMPPPLPPLPPPPPPPLPPNHWNASSASNFHFPPPYIVDHRHRSPNHISRQYSHQPFKHFRTPQYRQGITSHYPPWCS